MPETVLIQPKILESLEKLLEEKLKIKNYSIEATPGTILGDNYLGVIAKVVVNGVKENGEKCALNWIVKSAPVAPAFRQLAHVEIAYGREVFIYEKVFPELIKFQQEKNLHNPYTSFTPVHFTCMEEYNECLVMENMKEKGYKMKDRKVPLDIEHVLLVMKQYGRYHALSFALKDQKPQIFKEYADNCKDLFFTTMDREKFKPHFESYFDRAISALDPIKEEAALQKVQKLKEQAFDVLDEVLHPDSAKEYSVIGHGDCWLNNMLFKYEVSSFRYIK